MERKEAAALGLSKYDTGRPCIHGHPGIRYTANGICVGCVKSNHQKYSRIKGRSLRVLTVQVPAEIFDQVAETVEAMILAHGPDRRYRPDAAPRSPAVVRPPVAPYVPPAPAPQREARGALDVTVPAAIEARVRDLLHCASRGVPMASSVPYDRSLTGTVDVIVYLPWEVLEEAHATVMQELDDFVNSR